MLDAASQRRSKLLEEHKAVKAQLQALDKAAGTAAAKPPAAAAASDPDDESSAEASGGDRATSPAGGADPAAGSDGDSGDDGKRAANVKEREAAAAERRVRQRTLHQRRKAICAELDRTKEAVRSPVNASTRSRPTLDSAVPLACPCGNNDAVDGVNSAARPNMSQSKHGVEVHHDVHLSRHIGALQYRPTRLSRRGLSLQIYLKLRRWRPGAMRCTARARRCASAS